LRKGPEGADDVQVGFGEGVGIDFGKRGPGVVGAFEVAGTPGPNAREVGVQGYGEMAVGVGDGDEMGTHLDVDAHFFHEFAGDAFGHRFAVLDFAAGEFPKAGEHALVGASLGDENLVFGVEHDGGSDDFVGDFRLLGFDGECLGGTERCRLANAAHGAFGADGTARLADDGPQFHPSLVEGAGGMAFEQLVGELAEEAPRARQGDVGGHGKEAGKHPGDVAVENGKGLPEREGSDGCGRVGAEARECGQQGRILGKVPVVLPYEDGGGFVDLAGPGVVPEAFPKFQHVLKGSFGKDAWVREASKEAQKIGDDGIHPRLLEHDFRNPGCVGATGRRPPRQVARMGRKPWQQMGEDGAADGAQRLGRSDGHGGQDSGKQAIGQSQGRCHSCTGRMCRMWPHGKANENHLQKRYAPAPNRCPPSKIRNF
jgi:hypothetical protein